VTAVHQDIGHIHAQSRVSMCVGCAALGVPVVDDREVHLTRGHEIDRDHGSFSTNVTSPQNRRPAARQASGRAGHGMQSNALRSSLPQKAFRPRPAPGLQELDLGQEGGALLSQAPAVLREHDAPAELLQRRKAEVLVESLDLLEIAEGL